MDKRLESNNVNVDLLSQSYRQGIQKLAGDEETIPVDFQLPSYLIEQRKKSWNDLFEKYSSNKSQVELNISTLQPKSVKIDVEIMRKRLPMRKPMSVVQHWINTGSMPYSENFNTDTRSDTGSSLDEEYLESDSCIRSSCPDTNSSLEKHSGNTRTFTNQPLRLASSSGSSIDTAAYILASHNANKNSNSVDIIQNLKCNKNKLNAVFSHQLINSIVDASKHTHDTEVDPIMVEKRIEKENSSGKAISLKKFEINGARNSIEHVHIIKDNNTVEKLAESTATCPYSVCSIDSDESIINSKYDINLQNVNSIVNDVSCGYVKSNVIRLLKRKKLYKYTESPVELTPASEDNLSLKNYSIPVKKCEHPALETPRLSSKQSYLTRYKKINYRKKRNSRLLSFIKFNKKKQSPYLEDNDEKIDKFHSLCSYKSSQKNYFVLDDVKSSGNDSSNNTKLQYSLDKKFVKEKNKLKSLTIALYRLPYIYSESNEKTDFEIKNKKNLYPVKEFSKKYLENVSKSDSSFLNNDQLFENVSKLFFSSSDKKKSFKLFIDTQSDRSVQSIGSAINIDVSSEFSKNENNLVTKINLSNKSKCYSKSKQNINVIFEKKNSLENFYISDEEKENNKHSTVKSPKYGIVLSSSDESNEITIKSNKKTGFVKDDAKNNKSLNNQLALKQPRFKINSNDQFNDSDAISSEHRYLDTNNYGSSKKKFLKESNLSKLSDNKKSFNCVKIHENEFKNNKVQTLSKQKKKTIQSLETSLSKEELANKSRRQKSKKRTILFHDSSDEDSSLVPSSTNSQFNKFELEDNQIVQNLNDTDGLVFFNRKRKIDKPIDELMLQGGKLQIVGNKKLDGLKDLCDVSSRHIKIPKKRNKSSLEYYTNSDDKKCDKNSKFKKSYLSKPLLDDSVKDKSISRFNFDKKSHMENSSLLIKEKCDTVSISSDEECIVPLRMKEK